MTTPLNLVAAEIARENVVRFTFDAAVRFSGVLDPGDASDVARYSVSPVAGTVGADGIPVEPVAPALVERGPLPTQVDVTFDREASQFPSRYEATLNGLSSFDGGDLVLPAVRTFFGTRQAFVPPVEDDVVRRVDFANPQSASGLKGLGTSDESLLGTFFADTSGDYSTDSGIESLKKRVFRILTSKKGGFAHAPGWGVGLRDAIKKLASAPARAKYVADAEVQIARDPDVEKVRVKVEPSSRPGLFKLVILVRTSVGKNAKFSWDVAIGTP